ncbi:uncharacterized protein B0I36DRAFT_315190 [Microdochium trichocladiopsis]|uniref:Uncharacterized protein n=1 Tax=Microdochium trichocladiopsis TaxID=1682393 RepID=A0A9P8YFH7_9PEZI|nr:uncharacterized protein B0I36DRAFT_315190 [Microdochium trichocladiopsis]KAH7037972.1 hypothetical protein B0I36DRAFT_315190 [Microdochium trichocladiopsis]
MPCQGALNPTYWMRKASLCSRLNELRKVVFPKDRPWEREDEKLYSRMIETLLAWPTGRE